MLPNHSPSSPGVLSVIGAAIQINNCRITDTGFIAVIIAIIVIPQR